MQRVHFTVGDLARTRLRSTLGPVAEGVFALGVLAGSGQADYARWRGEGHRRLLQLRQAASWSPPAPLPRTVDAPDDLLFLLERAAPASGRPPLGPPRADAARLALDVWRAAVAPYWDRIGARLEAECEARGRIVMAGGVEELLATLHPRIVWTGSVLEIPDGPDREIHLDGRGLLLCPSVFLPGKVGRVVECERDTGMAALVFAAPLAGTRAADLWVGPELDVQALGALLGQTRAAALRVLTTSACTTSQLAARLGISSAGASQHTAVLRQSGLITTRRVRNKVLHTVTPLGLALLGGRLRHHTAAVSAPAMAGTAAGRTAAGSGHLAG
ncbi:ArsR/SmtB family transcription factor [Streptomyces sp. DSM 40750]|uniref:ArsR/SmtB family transcription factor n=1 Tax=Streptomyces sp. DSM 40750 TaxID=2801030 RepID=UPI00214ACA45|nr:winged helix-turn-helix domain-containing protein [Streptomyces sp. DSM 40750]UUU22859.1 winged helix-turn-helix domain-containing protein [Streptomyces sp. DSM 40750]